MPVALGIVFEQYKPPTNPVAIIRETTTRDFVVGESFLTHNSVPSGAKLTIRGKDHPISPIFFYTLVSKLQADGSHEEELEGRQLVSNEEYRILLNDEYRFYKLINNELVNLSLGSLVEGVVTTVDKNNVAITPNTPIDSMEPDKKYLILGSFGIQGQAYTITQVIDGIKVVEDLREHSIIYNERTATFQFYRNGILQDYSQPVPYTFYCGTNIKLYEDDGVTKRIIPRSEVVPFLPTEGGNPVAFPTNITANFTIVLNGQTDQTQNLVYVFRELTPNAGFSWVLNPPFNNTNFQRINAFDSALFQRGDGYQGIVYRLVSDPPALVAGTGQYVSRINWTPKTLATNLKWEKIDPSASAQKALEASLKEAQDKIKVLEAKLAPIYTEAVAITAKNGATIIIDGVGDINIWSGAVAGDFFKVSDTFLKLTTATPSVIPEDGYTINGETGPYSLSAIKADWEYDRNLFFRLDANKNWLVGRI